MLGNREARRQRRANKQSEWLARRDEQHREKVEGHRSAVATEIAHLLQSGESVHAAIGVVRGGQRSWTGGGLEGVALNLLEKPGNRRRVEQLTSAAAAVGFPDAQAMVLVATDRRLLVTEAASGKVQEWGAVGQGYGRPGELLADIPYGQLVESGGREVLLDANSTTPGMIAFAFAGGQTHGVACLRMYNPLRPDAGAIQDFVTTLNVAIATGLHD